MSALKEYFKEEFKWRMMLMEHSKPPDFYLGVWQGTRSTVPQLVWRGFLFLTSLGMLLSSAILHTLDGTLAYWFIYLTHWGLILITVTTLFATTVSARCYLYGPLSGDFPLPWYVKVYWILFNVAVPMAFLITLFYWTILYDSAQKEENNHGLDVTVHGLNSVVMFLLLVASAQPMRLLHVYQPLAFALVYVLFGVIYYAAGGTDQLGNTHVYPAINWEKPGVTLGYCAAIGLLLVVIFLLVVGIAVARDAVAARLMRPPIIVHGSEDVPLRKPKPKSENRS